MRKVVSVGRCKVEIYRINKKILAASPPYVSQERLIKFRSALQNNPTRTSMM
jgi:hypothetical protein